MAEPSQIPPFVCRFETVSPDGKVEDYRDFCAFEFPGCSGCSKAFHSIASVATTEDPLKSNAWGDNQSRRLPLRVERLWHLSGSKSNAAA